MALEGPSNSYRGPVYPLTQTIMDGSGNPWPINTRKETPKSEARVDFDEIVKQHPELIVYQNLAKANPGEFERIVKNLGII